MAHTAELEHAVFAELREVDRIKSEFMMLASHELRTPLTKIKAWLALMRDGGDHLPQQARQEGFHELRTEAEHLGRLTDNLLCIAQLESGEIRLRPTTVDFSAVLRQVISRFVEIADRGRFLVHIDENLGYLHVDEERLALVLACLIDNALKFAPDNEPVEITAVRVVNKAHVEVRDNGRRIPDTEVERVFASFYQVENPCCVSAAGSGWACTSPASWWSGWADRSGSTTRACAATPSSSRSRSRSPGREPRRRGRSRAFRGRESPQHSGNRYRSAPGACYVAAVDPPLRGFAPT